MELRLDGTDRVRFLTMASASSWVCIGAFMPTGRRAAR